MVQVVLGCTCGFVVLQGSITVSGDQHREYPQCYDKDGQAGASRCTWNRATGRCMSGCKSPHLGQGKLGKQGLLILSRVEERGNSALA
jgi:hypothetical protein